jgi:hypothetical protein
MGLEPLNMASGMPQMGAAFAGWETTLTLSKRAQQVSNDGLVAYTDTEIFFQGVVQPLMAEKIALKPEGQRSWQWLQIHCFSGAQNLATNDQITYNGKLYKVMEIFDYSLDNYIEYHCCYEYQP